MCAHLMLFTAICRPNLSVLEETGAWDIGFLIGVMGPVHSDQVTPGQCVCWGRVTALILVGLPLSPLALERHAIFCMWPKLLEFFGVVTRCSFILWALVQMHVSHQYHHLGVGKPQFPFPTQKTCYGPEHNLLEREF